LYRDVQPHSLDGRKIGFGSKMRRRVDAGSDPPGDRQAIVDTCRWLTELKSVSYES